MTRSPDDDRPTRRDGWTAGLARIIVELEAALDLAVEMGDEPLQAALREAIDVAKRKSVN